MKPDYVAYAAVAILSARERTARLLEPHVLVSTTEESSFVDWCIEQGVMVHQDTPILAEDVKAMIKNKEKTEEWGARRSVEYLVGLMPQECIASGTENLNISSILTATLCGIDFPKRSYLM